MCPPDKNVYHKFRSGIAAHFCELGDVDNIPNQSEMILNTLYTYTVVRPYDIS